MSRSWPADAAVNSEFATPNELNAELSELAEVAHDLDNDNLAFNRITAAKTQNGAFGNLFLSLPTAVLGEQTVHLAGDSSGIVYAMPKPNNGTGGVPWILEPTLSDCEFKMTLSAAWEDQALNQWLGLWIGIRVDGVLVAQSPLQSRGFWSSHASVRVDVPLAAGGHTIEMVYGLHEVALAATRTISWLSRAWSGIEVAR